MQLSSCQKALELPGQPDYSVAETNWMSLGVDPCSGGIYCRLSFRTKTKSWLIHGGGGMREAKWFWFEDRYLQKRFPDFASSRLTSPGTSLLFSDTGKWCKICLDFCCTKNIWCSKKKGLLGFRRGTCLLKAYKYDNVKIKVIYFFGLQIKPPPPHNNPGIRDSIPLQMLPVPLIG